jgi:hypothetical protein
MDKRRHGKTGIFTSKSKMFLPTILMFFAIRTYGQILQSGNYWQESARIAIDENHITGSVDTKIGENGQYVCQFFFDGKIKGKTFSIACHNFIDTGLILGSVTIVNDTSFFLKTRENPGGSNMIANIEDKGMTFSLTEAKKWLQIRIVTAEKAFFYTAPILSSKRKAYLIKGNEVIVLEKKEEWLKVTYGKTTGWLQENDMFPFYENP